MPTIGRLNQFRRPVVVPERTRRVERHDARAERREDAIDIPPGARALARALLAPRRTNPRDRCRGRAGRDSTLIHEP